MSKPKSQQAPLPYHYYAPTAFNWALADTMEEAIKKVAKEAGTGFIKSAVERNEGLNCVTVRVELPASANYSIQYYLPVDVPMSDEQHHRIVTAKGNFITTDDGRARAYNDALNAAEKAPDGDDYNELLRLMGA